jgi:hypothetical protein
MAAPIPPLDGRLLQIEVHVTHGAGHDQAIGPVLPGIVENLVGQVERRLGVGHRHPGPVTLGLATPLDRPGPQCAQDPLHRAHRATRGAGHTRHALPNGLAPDGAIDPPELDQPHQLIRQQVHLLGHRTASRALAALVTVAQRGRREAVHSSGVDFGLHRFSKHVG